MDDRLSEPTTSHANRNKRNLASDAPLKTTKEKTVGLARTNSIGWQQLNKAQPKSKNSKDASEDNDLKKSEQLDFSSLGSVNKDFTTNEGLTLIEKPEPTAISSIEPIKSNKDIFAERRNRKFRNPFSTIDVNTLENTKLPDDFDLSDVEYLPKPPQDDSETLEEFLEKPIAETLGQEEIDFNSSDLQLIDKKKPKFLSELDKDLSASFKGAKENILEEKLDLSGEDFKLPLNSLYFEEVDLLTFDFRDDTKELES